MDNSTLNDGMAVLYLLGAVQGIFLAAVLASRHRSASSNRLLAGLMGVFSLDLAMAVYHASDASARFPALIGLDLTVAFLYGPLLYLYVRTLTAGRPLRYGDLWHAAPFGLLTLFLLPLFLRPGPEKLLLMQHPALSMQTRALFIIHPLKLVHGFVYLTLVAYSIRTYWRRVQEPGSEAEHAVLDWLRMLIAGVVALLAVSAIPFALGTNEQAVVVGMDPAVFYDDMALLGMTLFVYAFGYFGLRHPTLLVPPVDVPMPSLDAPAVEAAPYARSGMRPQEAAHQRQQLAMLMETEHLYRRGDLTLQELADALGISAHNLTEVLSTQVGQSFYDLVNGYRVREVQERLADSAYAHRTVLSLGMDAGFNAKSSFNAAFKRHTGMTPSEYRQRQREVV